jgi:hypothetical protein
LKSIKDLKKAQHVNLTRPDLDLTQPGPIRFLPENQTDLTRPTRLIAASKKFSIVKNIRHDQLIARLIIIKR